MPTRNPFWHGTPVPLENFIGRDNELYSIASRIGTGQSVAIIGTPRSGKTSVLQYLTDPEKMTMFYGNNVNNLIFSHLDASLWDEQFSWVQFWEMALRPFYEQIQGDNASPLREAYQICRDNEFGSYVMGRFFAKLGKDKLILMIDEFDAVLHLPIRKSAQFFGGIRSLVTNSQGALATVIAINTSLTQLTEEVAKSTATGSSYFNHMTEVVLGALSDDKIEKLLNQASDHFSKEDYSFIKDMAGGHPYLLQVLASCLWELYERPDALDVKLRQHQATKDFYLKVTDSLERTWRSWPLKSQQDMMAVTFAQLDKLRRAFQRQGINVENISQQIPRLKSELEFLKRQGFVREDEKIAGGWRVYPKIFLHFIIDKKLELKYREKLPPEVWKTLLTPEFG